MLELLNLQLSQLVSACLSQHNQASLSLLTAVVTDEISAVTDASSKNRRAGKKEVFDNSKSDSCCDRSKFGKQHA